MSKFCIRKGIFNKKLLFPFFLAVVQLANGLINIYYTQIKNRLMDLFSNSIGQMLIIIIPHIKYFSVSNKEKTKCECSKSCILHYFILCLFFTIDNCVTLSYSMISTVIDQNDQESKVIPNLILDSLITKDGLEIILISLICMCLLKYKYFIHHYLSIVLIFISAIAMDLLLDNYSSIIKKNILNILPELLGIISGTANLCYIKYMIDRQYHHYWNIKFAVGCNLLLICIIFLMMIVLPKKNDQTNFAPNFFPYFQKTSLGLIISKVFVQIIIFFIFHVLHILTIFYLSPEFVLISQILMKILTIVVKEGNNKYICLIFFALQIFSLMIYLEIIELNFLKLNFNTKRNIKERCTDELIGRIDSFNDGGFEAGDGYFVANNDQNDNEKIELNPVIDNQTNDDYD